MTLQLTHELEKRLQHLADQTSSSPEELARKALDEFLSSQEELIASVRAAEERADREGWLTTEEVLDRVAKRFAAA